MKKRRKSPGRRMDRRIPLFILIGALALISLFLYNRASDLRAAEQAEMLKNALQSEVVPRRHREQGEAIFYAMVKEVRQSLPGFACWGDDCMAGKNALNLPAALEDALWRTFYGELSGDFTRCAGLKVALTGLIPAHNLGFPGEGLTEVTARSGASAIIVQDDFTVPHSTDPVAVALADDRGLPLAFDGQNYARLGRVEIGGVNGYFFPGNQAVNPAGAKLAFGRELGGTPTDIRAGTPVNLDAADRFVNCIPILFFREPADMPADRVAGDMAAIVNRHRPSSGQCVVLCATQRDSALDRALKGTFGEYYIRVDGDPSQFQMSDYRRLADNVLLYLDMQGALDSLRNAFAAARESLYSLQS